MRVGDGKQYRLDDEGMGVGPQKSRPKLRKMMIVFRVQAKEKFWVSDFRRRRPSHMTISTAVFCDTYAPTTSPLAKRDATTDRL